MEELDDKNVGSLKLKEYHAHALDGFYIQKNLLQIALEKTIEALKESIKINDDELDRLVKIIHPHETFTDEWWEVYRAISPVRGEQAFQEDQLFALNEMKVIYLFKTLEINLKSIVKRVYPSTNTKNLFQWDKMTDFFKQKGIQIKSIDGYTEVNELRILNNNFKHSQVIEDEARGIKEFKDDENIENKHLELFLERVSYKIEKFQIKLIEEVKKLN